MVPVLVQQMKTKQKKKATVCGDTGVINVDVSRAIALDVC